MQEKERYPVSKTGYQNDKTETETETSARILASRPDWLTVSVPDPEQAFLPFIMAELSGRLGSEEAIETEHEFFGATLYLQRDGAGRPRLIADGYCELRFFSHAGRVSAQFTVYSFPFWQDDAVAIFQYAHGLIAQVVGQEVVCVPVRLDMARDVEGFNLDVLSSLDAIFAQVVTRSRKKKPTGASGEYSLDGGRHVESVYLGGPKAPVRWAIYDKTLEAKQKGKTYYAAVWASAGYGGDGRVVRFEARLRGKVWRELGRYGVEHGLPPLTLENLHAWLPALWSWLTQSHTRMVVPDADEKNRGRLVTSAFWTMMQASFDDDSGVIVALQRERFKAPQKEALASQVDGTLLSLAALIPGSEDWTSQEVAQSVLDVVGWRCGEKRKVWKARVVERRALLAVS